MNPGSPALCTDSLPPEQARPKTDQRKEELSYCDYSLDLMVDLNVDIYIYKFLYPRYISLNIN